MHFENEIEHKILVTYVIAKVSVRFELESNKRRSSENLIYGFSDDLWII
ncbi:hypothetical protein NEIMUCOT_05045 [Neisseria mucosa ATCC 25996]|uniref:Uncharacterized protein n=1 Tax=Neisseria mucosa (strain ATCC 25996 / DSM 4631 / NCTC 10774 / M26) TaxID=546266 RepID=D2ZWP7_NEIM2|nr:hypothetical protein NEIMUCOT_05045 [Neisseria mucosa ATCC 25996]